MERACDACGDPYEAKTKRSRFCSANCRVAHSRRTAGTQAAAQPAADPPRRKTRSAERLEAEFKDLGVADLYEAELAIGIALQLDSGLIVGSQYTSLSKELDRRVDALRLRAEKPDDPARAVKDRLEEKRLSLVVGGP